MGVTLSQNQRAAILLIIIIGLAIAVRADYILDGGDRLLRYDPYYHYRMAETILEEGHRPEWDYTASWPTGQPGDQHPPLFPCFLAYSFRLFGWAAHHNLLLWCSYSVVILVILFIVLAFFTGKEFSDTKGGLFCALLFGLTAYSVTRTIIGFADTDGFILIFSLLATYFWVKTFSDSRKFVYAVLAGFSLFLFELTWVGYWHLVFLLGGASLTVITIKFLKKEPVDLIPVSLLFLSFAMPHSFYSHFFIEGVILVLAALILLVMYRYPNRQHIVVFGALSIALIILYREGFLSKVLSSLNISQPVSEKGGAFFPNIGPFISQRQQVTLSYLLENFTVALFLAPAGLYILLKQKNSYHKAVFLVLYFAGGILMSLSGVRFLLILMIPVLISSGVALSKMWDFLVKGSPGRKLVAVCLISFLIVPVYATTHNVNETSDEMSDDWWNALMWIKENTPPESVVISDWGNGYWIESIAERKSVMNGGHYDIYWRLLKFGEMLDTTMEKIAVQEVFGFDSSDEAEQVRPYPPGDEGAKLVEAEMTPFAVEGQDAYLVLDTRTAMVFNIVSYLGTWDYITGEGKATYLYGATPVGTVLRPQVTEYLYNTVVGNIIIFETQGEYHSYILEGQSLAPTQGTVYTTGGTTYYLTREDGRLGVVWFDSDSLAILIPSDAMDTMMVRLFFFNGDGLQYFEKVADFGTVRVFKIHRAPQENLNQPVVEIKDEWQPS
ncbi:MAG: STT3 domain-containing protein [Candidatus Methanofastidiosia archaeon]